MRLLSLLAACAALVAAPALAQSYSSPSEMLAAFYEPYLNDTIPDDISGFRSEALNTLYAEDEANTPLGEIGALDFDPYIDGQDFLITDLEIEELEVGNDTATVLVTFQNMGEPRSITYDLVFEDGGWRIDDLVGENVAFTYRLSEIFEDAAP